MPLKDLQSRGSPSPAEASDRLAYLTAAIAGVAAVIYASNALENFVPSVFVDFLQYGRAALGLVILVAYLPSILFLKWCGGRAEGVRSAGGFLNAIMRKAASTAFNLTIGFVVALSFLERSVLSNLTADSAVDLVIGFSLAAFSVSFFIINHLNDVIGNEQ